MSRMKAASLAAASLTIALFAPPASTEPAKELRIVVAGGQMGDAMIKCYDTPFQEKYGIKVVQESPAGFAKLNGMVQSGNVTAALIDLESGEMARADAQSLVEPIEWDKVKPASMYEDAKQPNGFGYSYFSTVMAWRPDAKAPANWRDFFDVANFPGKRALPDYPGYLLPFAAIADGVEPDKVFPLDLDRAFKALERIKDHVVWWQSGAQAVQLLRDNEVQYSIAWSGRIVGNADLSSSFQQGLLDKAWLAVPKGADPAMKEAAWLYLHEISDPQRQACIAQYISYTGPATELDALLPKDRLNQFPTFSDNRKVQFATDAKWWYDHADEVEQRWQEFRLAQ